MEIDEDNALEQEAEDDFTERAAEDIQDIEDDDGSDSGLSNLKPTKQRADVWKHFEEIIENGVKYAKYNHCDK